MASLDEITGWTKEELAAGWRFGIWRNATPGNRGDYVRDGSGKILRFERTPAAYVALKAAGLRYHVGPERPLPSREAPKKRKKAAPLTLSLFEPPATPTGYVCAIPPDQEKAL